MTVTVVCDVLGEENNGTSVAEMNLIRYLQKRGHEVRVLCADQTKRGRENFFVVPERNLGKVLNGYIKKVGVSLANPDLSIVRKALTGSDIVHIMMPLSLGAAAAKTAYEMGIAITAGFHMQAENFTCHIKMNRLRFVNNLVYRSVYRRLYRYADAVHYPTQFIKRTFESRTGKRTNGYVISNGVQSFIKKYDADKPEEMKDKFVILSVGRYSTEKSQDTLIKAVARSAYADRIQLILAGQGAKEKKYKKLAKKLPVPPVFRLYGREELCDVINYCDLYVHPAVAELEGIACLESIACGKTTVVSDSANSATKDFAIDNKCVFKKRNAKDLARVIDYWIEHPEEREEYGRKYLESGVVLSQEECMERMEEMMLSALSLKCAERVGYECAEETDTVNGEAR